MIFDEIVTKYANIHNYIRLDFLESGNNNTFPVSNNPKYKDL
jgi:hypothetical protein